MQRECGDRPPDGLLALRWLNDRYRQIWQASPWEFARKRDVFTTADDITSDSVTVTNLSATVTETTSDGKWSASVIGRKFRATGDDEYYGIAGYSNANPDTLALADAYVGATATVKGYRIFQNLYSLNVEVGQLEGITDLSTGVPLREVNAAWLDSAFPNRSGVGIPRVYAVLGRDANDIQQVELYPIPNDDRIYEYPYVQEAPYLTGAEAKLVPQVFEQLLKSGWLADYWGWRATMDDATGQERAHAGYNELLFSRQLQEMAVREAQNQGPSVIRLAPRYVRHRYIRSWPFRLRHNADEMP